MITHNFRVFTTKTTANNTVKDKTTKKIVIPPVTNVVSSLRKKKIKN